MKIEYSCIPCSIHNYLRLVEKGMIPPELQEAIFRRMLTFFSTVDYRLSPPALGQQLHRILREMLNNPDPYRDVKRQSNEDMVRMVPFLEEMVAKASDSFNTALRLAIAGNVIDFGSFYHLDILETITSIISSTLAIDHSASLKEDLARADTVLYIGDNAGEIVLDKIFLKLLNHAHIYFAVRGNAVLNDALLEDAEALEIDRYATLITTGDDAPGVIRKTASDQFNAVFDTADVIISKGQGNYEGLSDEPGNIYYLLVTKCSLVASHIGVPEKSYVVLNPAQRGG